MRILLEDSFLKKISSVRNFIRKASFILKSVRPGLNDPLNAKVVALQDKRKEMNIANKVLRENLKDASKEDRKEMITAFKKENREKHQEIKIQSQEVKKEIRSLVEKEVTRTSDF